MYIQIVWFHFWETNQSLLEIPSTAENLQKLNDKMRANFVIFRKPISKLLLKK